ncbi:hypothetical protein O9H85_14030 [Paenibacillus filicis]|uniref:Uncharacterized protein n=1 Tax=Paenibacillus gyeongsangnamensis TaxID=3388067 RepID=A0ABT4Q9U4_9BACL|nr:hypothetical protein [Paenibacillus filicis]MCZ8513532.1 hypothetical protein [Paenibacillus filicis]
MPSKSLSEQLAGPDREPYGYGGGDEQEQLGDPQRERLLLSEGCEEVDTGMKGDRQRKESKLPAAVS